MKRRDVLKEFWLLNVALSQGARVPDADRSPAAGPGAVSTERAARPLEGALDGSSPSEVPMSGFEAGFRLRRS